MSRKENSHVSFSPRIKSLAAALSIALIGSGGAVSATQTAPKFAGFEHGHALLSHARPTNKHELKANKLLDMHRASDAIKHVVASLPAARPSGRAPLVVHVTHNTDSGQGSLRSALETAVDGDVIDLSTLRGKISLTTALHPSANVEIRGPGRGRLTLDGGGLDRVIASGHSLRISNVTIANGAATTTRPVGGCILIYGELALTNATVQNCALDGVNYGYAYGGAIAVLGDVDIESSTISDNSVTAPYYAGGGGLAVIGQAAYKQSSIADSTISGNQVTAGSGTIGGGVAASYHTYGTAGSLSVSNTTVTGNTMNATTEAPYYYAPYGYTYYGTGDGAGIWAQATNITLTGSTVTANAATGNATTRGAGVFSQHVKYYDTVNSVYVPVGGQATISSSDITNNVALSKGSAASGGGVYADSGLSMDHSTVSGNTAQTDTLQVAFAGGGGVYTGKYAEVSIVSSTVSGNVATATAGGASNGGAFCNKYSYNYASKMSVINSTVSGNSATAFIPTQSFGGGFYQSYQSTPIALTIENSTVAFNIAGGAGGGVVAAYNATTTFNSVIFSNNAASVAGTEEVTGPPAGISIDGSNNLFKVDPTSTGVTLTGTDNILGQDAVLLPLAFNGGPTQTHALDPSSPAVDTGSNPEALDFDQRGIPYARMVGASPDIGAFELDTDRIFANGFE